MSSCRDLMAMDGPGPRAELTPCVTREEHDQPLLLRTADGQTREVRSTLRVGSAPDNDWVIEGDPLVSRYHLLLVPGRGYLKVRDMRSTNGTYVNGARTEQGQLAPGGSLTLGSTRLRMVLSAGGSNLLGPSRQMEAVRQRIQKLAPARVPVLILGESGTGKELVARSLHEGSGRGPFIAVNCGALPRELIESELFGHDRGAFTGAQRRHLGCFAEANGGTLFLDEIGELPLDVQPRLLRALESGCIRPVGQSREIPLDLRIVAATHQDLERAVARREFRQDLYYRLAVTDVYLPPLRERPEDIGFLLRHFLREHGGAQGPCTLSAQEAAFLEAYTWPGNVRELRNATMRALCLGGPRLRARDFLDGPRRVPTSPTDREGWVQVLSRDFAEIERDVYLEVLRKTGQNRRAAAEMLRLSKSTFYDRMRRLGLAEPDED